MGFYRKKHIIFIIESTSDPLGTVVALDKIKNPMFGPPSRQSSSISDIMVRMSYPIQECKNLVESFSNLIGALVELGITHVTLTDSVVDKVCLLWLVYLFE